MNKFFVFAGMVAGGWLGWALGESGGMMTAFLVSTLGSVVGVILGWKLNRMLFH